MTALYRHFSESGELLYVGTSSQLLNRTASHESKGWARQITIIKVEHYEDREMALMAEKKAIVDEKPKHNIMRPSHKNTERLQRDIESRKFYLENIESVQSLLADKKDDLRKIARQNDIPVASLRRCINDGDMFVLYVSRLVEYFKTREESA